MITKIASILLLLLLLLIIKSIYWNQFNVISLILCNPPTHRYSLFRSTQHFYCYFLTLRISIEDDHHLLFFYKILKLELKKLLFEKSLKYYDTKVKIIL